MKNWGLDMQFSKPSRKFQFWDFGMRSTVFFKKEDLFFNVEVEFVKYILFGFFGEQNRASGSVYHTPLFGVPTPYGKPNQKWFLRFLGHNFWNIYVEELK